ncbi:hypothetical protein CCHR01_12136 [Colletotrichum chrysophilum]|uniref:Uncharacterized protein n=1 Tax=Colletotrichum chrysophilum TaxID=1836956 RepID=A0AAD9ACR3_9PEZI|nr:hypothetical protein CCHR01_12136 [Colletotrichum chrysophilum]
MIPIGPEALIDHPPRQGCWSMDCVSQSGPRGALPAGIEPPTSGSHHGTRALRVKESERPH